MDFSTCYMTAGVTIFLVCIVLGTAKVKDPYDRWTGDMSREFLAYFIVGPICAVLSMLLGILIGG